MLEIINRILWVIAISCIFISGIYFTIKLKFIQLNFKEVIRNTVQKTDKGISPFKTLMLALAGRIGVGSIAGIALAIHVGGIGSIFWIWLVALIGATNAFAETVLGILYKEKDEGNVYRGGPSYYINKGLGKTTLSKIYAIIIIVSYIVGFISIQSNTITKSINEFTPINSYIIGIVLCLVTVTIIYGGIEKIANATGKLVPIMTLIYLGVTIYVIIRNINLIPTTFYHIFKEAFNFKPFIASFIPMVTIGIQRGIFSNEAGLGTGAIAASVVETNDATSQGYVQMLGIYITTFLVCTSTAIIVLTSDYTNLTINDINGIEITQYAFNQHLGGIGSLIIMISIFLFAFSTILTGYYYGESNLKYLIKNIQSKHLIILKLCTVISIFLGSIAPSNMIWQIVDILVAILAIINIYALIGLRKKIFREVDNYQQRKI